MKIPAFTVEENSPLYQTYLAEREDRGEDYSFEQFLESLTGGKKIEDSSELSVDSEETEDAPENYFAQNLKYLRERYCYIEGEVARAIGISRAYYSTVESGKNVPVPETMIAFGKFYNITVNALVFEDLKSKASTVTARSPELTRKIVSNVYALIKRSGKSIRQVSSESSLGQTVLWGWRNNKNPPSTKALIKLAKYFNVSMDDLLFKDLSAE